MTITLQRHWAALVALSLLIAPVGAWAKNKKAEKAETGKSADAAKPGAEKKKDDKDAAKKGKDKKKAKGDKKSDEKKGAK